MSQYSRLPTHVLPCSYKLRLEPNFESFTFNGQVDILIEVTQQVDQLVINAKNIDIKNLQLKKSKESSPKLKKARSSVEEEEDNEEEE